MPTARRQATLYTFIGGTSQIALSAISTIILVPLYLDAIGTKLYGAWLGSGEILVWMLTFDLGLPSMLTQRVGAAHGRDDQVSTGEWFFTGLWPMAAVALLLGLVGTFLSFWLPGLYRLNGDDARQLQQSFVIGSWAVAAMTFNHTITSLARGIQLTGFVNLMAALSALVAFVVSLVMVRLGYNIYSIPGGLAARSAVLLGGSGVFVFVMLPPKLRAQFRYRRKIFKEYLLSMPATALGGLSYAAMNQSELFIASVFLSPGAAVLFMLVRKASEIARGVVNQLTFAWYGSFSHLVASDQKHRALLVYGELVWLRTAVAMALMVGYVALNPSLLKVWVKLDEDVTRLTLLVGAQSFVLGAGYLVNYAYRATDKVVEGSLAFTVEAVARIGLMIYLVLVMGLYGIPIAGIITAGIAWAVYHVRTVRRLAVFAEADKPVPAAVWAVTVACAAVATVCCLYVAVPSWAFVLVTGALLVTGGFFSMMLINPKLKTLRGQAAVALRKLVRARGGAP